MNNTFNNLFNNLGWIRSNPATNGHANTHLPWINEKTPRRAPSSGNELSEFDGDSPKETEQSININSQSDLTYKKLREGVPVQNGSILVLGDGNGRNSKMLDGTIAAQPTTHRESKSWPGPQTDKLLKWSPADEKELINYINEMHRQARLNDAQRQGAILDSIYITFPKGANLHVHSEGIPTSFQLHKLILENGENLFWDKTQKKCKWKMTSKKRQISEGERVPWKKLDEVYIKSICCCPDVPFDDTFGPRGQFLDYTSYETFLGDVVIPTMKEDNVFYQEVMFGVYPPVPKDIINYIENFHDKMTPGNMRECINFLKDKKLKDLLNPVELKKFRSFINRRIKNNPTGYCTNLMNMSYPQAFKTYLETFLGALNPKYFDVKEEFTIKLIFEVMRHYSLGEFFATLYSVLEFIENDNSIIRGFNIVGPQKNPNSIKYFTDHMNSIEYLCSLFKKAKVTLHALEYSGSDSKGSITHATKEFKWVPMLANRMGHGIVLVKSENLSDSLHHLQKQDIAFEICPSTGTQTTGVDIKNFALQTYHANGIIYTLATDDPGIVDTDMTEEIKKAILHLNLSFEDIVKSCRTSLYSSFLEGPSIYNVKRSSKIDTKGRSFTQVDFEIKEPFSQFNWENAAEVRSKMMEFELSEKQKKECQYEIKLQAFKEKLRDKYSQYTDLSYVPPPDLIRSNSEPNMKGKK